MNDITTGYDSLSELCTTQVELKPLLSQGGFKFRKLCANDKHYFEQISLQDIQLSFDFSENDDNSLEPMNSKSTLLQPTPLKSVLSAQILSQSSDF